MMLRRRLTPAMSRWGP